MPTHSSTQPVADEIEDREVEQCIIAESLKIRDDNFWVDKNVSPVSFDNEQWPDNYHDELKKQDYLVIKTIQATIQDNALIQGFSREEPPCHVHVRDERSLDREPEKKGDKDNPTGESAFSTKISTDTFDAAHASAVHNEPNGPNIQTRRIETAATGENVLPPSDPFEESDDDRKALYPPQPQPEEDIQEDKIQPSPDHGTLENASSEGQPEIRYSPQVEKNAISDEINICNFNVKLESPALWFKDTSEEKENHKNDSEVKLIRLVIQGLWKDVDQALRKHKPQDGLLKLVLEEAFESATDSDFAEHILPHCSDDQLQDLLTRLVSKGMWNSANQVIEKQNINIFDSKKQLRAPQPSQDSDPSVKQDDQHTIRTPTSNLEQKYLPYHQFVVDTTTVMNDHGELKEPTTQKDMTSAAAKASQLDDCPVDFLSEARTPTAGDSKMFYLKHVPQHQVPGERQGEERLSDNCSETLSGKERADACSPNQFRNQLHTCLATHERQPAFAGSVSEKSSGTPPVNDVCTTDAEWCTPGKQLCLFYDARGLSLAPYAVGFHNYPSVTNTDHPTSELWRLSTFARIEASLGNGVHPLRLAQSGFYYNSEQNKIVCFSCGFHNPHWRDTKQVDLIHLQNSPNCDFIKTRTEQVSSRSHPTVSCAGASENAAVADEIEEPDSTPALQTPDSNGLPEPSLPAETETESARPEQEILSTDSETTRNSPANNQNFGAAEDTIALQPLSTKGSTSFDTPISLSHTPSVGQAELTRFELQAKTNGTAVLHSVVASLLSAVSPTQSREPVQVYHCIIPVSAITSTPLPRYPVQVEQDPQGTPNQPSNRSGQLNDHDEAPGLDMRRAVSPGNALVAVRIATFASWPGRNLPQPRVLVLAGFYYMGIGDSVRCFYCGVTLKNWRANDDVWETHVRFRFSCDYVHFIKGDDFVCRTLIKLANGGRVPAESGLAGLPSTQSATNGSCTPAVSTNVSEQTINATNGGYPNGEHGSTQVSAQAQSQVATARDTTRPGHAAREVIAVGNSATRDATTAGNLPAREATETRLPSSGVQAGGRSSAAAGNRASVTNAQVPEDRVDSASHVGQVGARGASNGCTARGQNGDLQMDVEGSASTPASTQRAATVTGQQVGAQQAAVNGTHPAPTQRAATVTGGQQQQVGAQQAEVNGSQPVAVSSTRPSSVSTERPQPPRGISTVNRSSVSGRTEDVSSHLQELSETNRRLRQQRTCRLCGQRSVDTIFLPCGHLCTCEVCAATIRDCCLCRDRIRGTAHVFLE